MGQRASIPYNHERVVTAKACTMQHKPVLCNIIEVDRVNNLVESMCRNNYKTIKLEDIIRKIQQQNCIETIYLLSNNIRVE